MWVWISGVTSFAAGAANVFANDSGAYQCHNHRNQSCQTRNSPRRAPNIVKVTKIAATIMSIITGVVILAYLLP